jgi:hypothetical protein
MTRYLLRGVLPALAAAAVVLILLVVACGFVDLGLSIAAATKLDTLGKAVNIAFIAFLFVFATGIVPCIVLKKLQITNLPAYLLTGAVCGVLAEYCYLFNDEFWFGWDFSEPTFVSVLASAIRDMPDLLAGMVPMLPWSAIPVVVGLLGSWLYWMHARQRFANIATLGELAQALRRGVLAALAMAGVYLFLLCIAAGLAHLQLVVAAVSAFGTAAFFAMVALLIAGLLAMASGLMPAIVMHRFRVRSLAPYLLNAIPSGLQFAYAFSFNYGVGDNLGAMLMRRPLDGVNPASGWHFFAPPFADTLQDLFRGLGPFLSGSLDTLSLSEATVMFGPALLCGVLFWVLVVRRSARSAPAQASVPQ